MILGESLASTGCGGAVRDRVGVLVASLGPAFLVVTFVAWVILHHRLEAGLGDVLRRRWGRMAAEAPGADGAAGRQRADVRALRCAAAVALVRASDALGVDALAMKVG